MDTYYFSCDSLTVGYHNHPVVKKITVQLHKGEILTLIGPNGAGKSTILKTIAMQLEAISGSIFLSFQDWKLTPAKQRARKMAVVFTDKMHTEMMSCEDVVCMGRYPYTGHFGILSEEDRQAVDRAFELVHAKELRQQDFRCISDGQRQRILLAKALCQEPEILLLDEPTSFLDMKHKLEFLSILQKLAREKNLTVIMSLHELDLAERISDKILCVKGEYVEHMGTPEEVFTKGCISKLFDMTSGAYDEVSGDIELEAPKGEAKIFVIAGNGSGRNIFRLLQRKQIPFAAGILYQNDIDYPVAKALATRVISVPAFSRIQEEDVEKAKEMIAKCEKIICCCQDFGEWAKANQVLLEYAEQKKISIEYKLYTKKEI